MCARPLPKQASRCAFNVLYFGITVADFAWPYAKLCVIIVCIADFSLVKLRVPDVFVNLMLFESRLMTNYFEEVALDQALSRWSSISVTDISTCI